MPPRASVSTLVELLQLQLLLLLLLPSLWSRAKAGVQKVVQLLKHVLACVGLVLCCVYPVRCCC
jgi:hypothetical protein